jgi:hypothetical protein
MIELVFVACLVAAPDSCEERAMRFMRPMSPRTCLRRAQPELARWSLSHPKWRIAHWSCRPAGIDGIPT